MGKEEEEKKRSIHEDNTNVLAKEFKLFVIKRFGEQISLLIINVNELKSKSTIFDKLPNEVMCHFMISGQQWRDGYLCLSLRIF